MALSACGFRQSENTNSIRFQRPPLYIWVPLILLTTLFVIGIIPGCTLLWYDDWINAGVEEKIENEMFEAVDQAILEGSSLDPNEYELFQNASKLFD